MECHAPFSHKDTIKKSILTTICCLLIHAVIVSASAIVNPHPFTYHLNNEHLCRSNPDVLIWVHTAPNHHRHRRILRETWANPNNFHKHTAKLVFFLGMSTVTNTQSMIEYESEFYNDIVQETYLDSYRNLTYKAIAGCKWMSTYCKSAGTIVKVDDDMTVDIYLLFNHLHHLQSNGKVMKNTIFCDVWMNRWPDRKPGKWRVSKEEYSKDSYPTYCPGLGLVMTGDIVPKLYNASFYEPYFWIDDVYFTGLLAQTVNVTFERLGATIHFGSAVKIKMQTSFTNYDSWVFYHMHDLYAMDSMWDMIKQREYNRREDGHISYV